MGIMRVKGTGNGKPITIGGPRGRQMAIGGAVVGEVPPFGEGEPFLTGADTVIVQDGFDGFASPDARHTELQALRTEFGAGSHPTFISDNRPVDEPAAGFYELHQVVSPGRGGSGRALRSRYLGDEAGNQTSAWVTWPSSNSKYTPINATIAGSVWFRVTSEGWVPEFPGWKFWELWYSTGTHRIQASLNPGEGSAWWRVNISNTEVGAYVTGMARWADVNADASVWHRLGWKYKASDSAGDGTGIFQGWVDGVLAWDISPDGVTSGACSQAELEMIETYGIYYLKWPDVLNQNVQATVGVTDWDDFSWWRVA